MTFTFKLERPDGTSANPPDLRLGIDLWNAGDTITLGLGRSLH
jgi:hypothetical protein